MAPRGDVTRPNDQTRWIKGDVGTTKQGAGTGNPWDTRELVTVAINIVGGLAKICSSTTRTGRAPANGHSSWVQNSSKSCLVDRTPYAFRSEGTSAREHGSTAPGADGDLEGTVGLASRQ